MGATRRILNSMEPIEESHAGDGGTAAPPPEQSANRVRAGLTREYERAEIRVRWYASQCINSGAYIHALPAAFNPMHRPWVGVGAAPHGPKPSNSRFTQMPRRARTCAIGVHTWMRS